MGFNWERLKVFYGWYVVGACLLIALYASGVIFFGFTAVFEPIAKEFGWSYAQISLAASLRGLEMGLMAPVMGLLVDRWGPRKLVSGGCILIFMGFLVFSRVSSLAMFYGAFVLISIGMSTCTQTVLMTAVTNWFRRKAGMAVGIVSTGYGLGGLIVPVLTKVIDILQWRMAMFAVGLGALAIALPLSFLIRHKPENYGYQPDGDVRGVVETTEAQIPTADVEVNTLATQAIRSRVFWHLSVGAACHSFVLGAIVTHIMPYLSSIGIVRSLSSLVALSLPVTSNVGRLSSGWLADRFGGVQIFTVSFLLATVGLLFFGYVTTGMVWLLVPFIITFSIGWGFSVTTRVSLTREYFGRSNFGTIFGFLSGIMMVGNLAGAPLAGWVFDIWGSYKGAWLGCGAISLVGAALVFTIPSPSSAVRDPG
ncbi:MFS transporter [Chloroflexota bacterium]